jgi:hypothetical protein
MGQIPRLCTEAWIAELSQFVARGDSLGSRPPVGAQALNAEALGRSLGG